MTRNLIVLIILLLAELSGQAQTPTPKNLKIGDEAYGGIIVHIEKGGKSGMVAAKDYLPGLYYWEDAVKALYNLDQGGFKDWGMRSRFSLSETLNNTASNTSKFTENVNLQKVYDKVILSDQSIEEDFDADRPIRVKVFNFSNSQKLSSIETEVNVPTKVKTYVRPIAKVENSNYTVGTPYKGRFPTFKVKDKSFAYCVYDRDLEAKTWFEALEEIEKLNANNSGIIWSMPRDLDVEGMYAELHLKGLGDFLKSSYWSSPGGKLRHFINRNGDVCGPTHFLDKVVLNEVRRMGSVRPVRIFSTELVSSVVDNIAQGKPAKQSSDATVYNSASRAIDGSTWCGISITNAENDPWWEVDLGGMYDVSEIKVSNKLGNQLQNFYIMLSELPIATNSTTDNQYATGPMSFGNVDEFSKSFKKNAKGRYIRIFIQGDRKVLSLAEVEVMGAPAAQTTCEASATKLKYQTSMNKGDKLFEGEKLISANGKYQLRGTSSGDFVIEEILNSTACQYREVWKFQLAGSMNKPPAVSELRFQADCNICIDSKQNKNYFLTNGKDDNAYILYKCEKAVLTDDGRFVLVNNKGGEIWSAPDPFQLLPAGTEGKRNASEIQGREVSLEVLFVDFEDQKVTSTNFDELWNIVTSNGELTKAFQRHGVKLNVKLNKAWKRMTKNLAHYFPTNTDDGNWLWKDYTKHSVELLGQGTTNYPPNTIVVVVPNKGATGFKGVGSGAHGAHDFRGIRRMITLVPNVYNEHYTTMMHEIGHCYGSGELYPASLPYLHEVGGYDLMGDAVLATSFMGWHRFRYGWLFKDQTRYLSTKGDYKIDLKKLSSPSGIAMVVVPDKTNTSKMWVIEIGQDVVSRDQFKAGTGKLNTEGERIIVYTVEDPVVLGKQAIRLVPRTNFSLEHGTLKWLDDVSYTEASSFKNFTDASAPFSFTVDKKVADGFTLTVKMK